ncbi:MAG: hypothetical protein RLZZ391_214 [Bacteroidota bacterium]|jgi:hypothetical protein
MHLLNITRQILLILLILNSIDIKVFGQSFALQSFTQSSTYFGLTKHTIVQLDWQLDLGNSTIELNQARGYFFTAGFLQPTIYRHQNNIKPIDYEPKILIHYNVLTQCIQLSAQESELIIYGVHVFNFSGALIYTHKTKISSSRLSFFIPLSNQSSGIYFIQVFYLPENISPIHSFWIKTQKIVRQ